jgi:Transposase DDE domain
MYTLTKSPLTVARRALATGEASLRCYSHHFSPRKYTQPQLFACLALKVFFRTDYRGISVLLYELPELAAALRLRAVPHFTTLHKAGARLLRRRRFRQLLGRTLRRLLGRRRRVKRAAFDSTGFECGHTSHYFVRRRAKGAKAQRKLTYSRWAKLEAAFETSSQLILAAIPRRGPRVDSDRFVPLLEEALRQVRLTTVLADAGYDSESNHRYARERRKVRSVIPATAGRPTSKLPSGKWRRRMKQRLNKHYCSYGQRWQAESGFSRGKRRLGSAVNGRTYASQCRDLLLLVLTYNLMLD